MEKSPPKRMTRARAAAKAGNQPTISNTSSRILKKATSASKPKMTRATSSTAASVARSVPSTTRASLKRKQREDDEDDEDELCQQTEPSGPTSSVTARNKGRPRKIAAIRSDPQAEKEPTLKPSIKKSTNAKGKRKAIAPPAAPVRITRTQKTAGLKTEDTTATDTTVEDSTIAKRTSTAISGTRTRTATASTRSSAAKRPLKKTVTFEEPDAGKAPAPGKTRMIGSGLRAKPVRKATATRSIRSIRASSVEDKTNEKTPLSPRKVTQMPVKKATRHGKRMPSDAKTKPLAVQADLDPVSDDELAVANKTPMKKAPLRPCAANQRKDNKENELVSVGDDHTLFSKSPSSASAPNLFLKSPLRKSKNAESPSHDTDILRSPPKRIDLTLGPPIIDMESSAPPIKMSLFQSPAKKPLFSLKTESEESTTLQSPFKSSLFKSPAKRGSPMKASSLGQDHIETKPSDLTVTPAPKLIAVGTPIANSVSADLANIAVQEAFDQVTESSPTEAKFTGRLSSILPRDADPALNRNLEVAKELTESQPLFDALDEMAQVVVTEGRQMDTVENTDELAEEIEAEAIEQEKEEAEDSSAIDRNNTKGCQDQTSAQLQLSGDAFCLRQEDLEHFSDGSDWEEDEQATPAPVSPLTPKENRNMESVPQLGFTPLAKKLSDWRASSPKAKIATAPVVEEGSEEESSHENRVSLRQDDLAAMESEYESDADAEGEEIREEMEILEAAQKIGQKDAQVYFDPFSDTKLSEEDVQLAAEANEMSLLDDEKKGDMQTQDDMVSEGSQEYGDENAIPVDPALAVAPPVTPNRKLNRAFHTVSKIPLKPADNGSGSQIAPKQRRASAISCFPTNYRRQRAWASRNATVISYSPTQGKIPAKSLAIDVPVTMTPCTSGPTTPEVAWSTAVTPARTPSPDVNPALLKGAVVFVDVHTAEGADANAIFIDLLTQMGAKCIKSWHWNSTSPTSQVNPFLTPGQAKEQTEVGITHVVYKDGCKRTLEKVRESGGVVICVGVSWVLDCERANEWLDESSYLIDTSLLSRGGPRRRKSMEPRALANMNDTLVSSKSSGLPTLEETQSAPTTPSNKGTGSVSDIGRGGNRRRESSVWVRTPEKPAEGDMEHNPDNTEDPWNTSGFLTPLPKTPAPEVIANFAANVSPGTTISEDWSMDDSIIDLDFDSGGSGIRNSVSAALGETPLGAKTCPPKNKFSDLGQGILGREKDKGVLLRLMAARRKSLQWAPKVASPLSKAWRWEGEAGYHPSSPKAGFK